MCKHTKYASVHKTLASIRKLKRSKNARDFPYQFITPDVVSCYAVL